MEKQLENDVFKIMDENNKKFNEFIDSELKKNVVKKSNQPHNIKTPQTVEEFRNNLKKYFVCIGENTDKLYVGNCDTDGINVNELNSLSDLYNRRIGTITPTLSPKVNPKKDFKEYMYETNQFLSFDGYFEDENNYEIIEDKNTFIMDYEPKWIGLDNQIYREFFMLTLGEFSGYIYSNKN